MKHCVTPKFILLRDWTFFVSGPLWMHYGLINNLPTGGVSEWRQPHKSEPIRRWKEFVWLGSRFFLPSPLASFSAIEMNDFDLGNLTALFLQPDRVHSSHEGLIGWRCWEKCARLILLPSQRQFRPVGNGRKFKLNCAKFHSSLSTSPRRGICHFHVAIDGKVESCEARGGISCALRWLARKLGRLHI